MHYLKKVMCVLLSNNKIKTNVAIYRYYVIQVCFLAHTHMSQFVVIGSTSTYDLLC